MKISHKTRPSLFVTIFIAPGGGMGTRGFSLKDSSIRSLLPPSLLISFETYLSALCLEKIETSVKNIILMSVIMLL